MSTLCQNRPQCYKARWTRLRTHKTKRHRRKQGSQAGRFCQQPSRQSLSADHRTRSLRKKPDAACSAPVVSLCSHLQTGLRRVVIIRDIQSEAYDGASTALDHVDVSRTTSQNSPDGYRLVIESNPELAGTVLTADPVSVRVSRLKEVYAPSAMYAASETPSVLKLPVDWPATEGLALSRRVQPVSIGESLCLTSITTRSWR
jgi:hypothetical protein